ncbi:cytidylate kinase family protein [Candidatus Woesearchaeota archaeon]|nr:cytidylate kinase family protein [Candidatus Woesearchaeota archaeon]
MIIAISGTAGSGKSTVAKILAEKLGYKHYSMGDFQREIAKAKGLSILKLMELEKTDPSIDRMVDEKQKKIGQTEDNFIIDAWLSPHFIPHAYKIFMDADPKIRSKRVSGKKREAETYKTEEEAVEAFRKREEINKERWIRYYGFDYTDKKNYDLVVDTTDKDINQVVELILGEIKKKS